MSSGAFDAPGTWDAQADLIVLGGGAAGMTAALVGALRGLRVILLEKAAQVGGTTAFSSGTVWVPGNAHALALGMTDDLAQARLYLTELVGERAPAALREAFLRGGPEMLAYLASRTPVRFKPYPVAPDYRQDVPGAAQGGRPLEPLPFDGRTLGAAFNRLRPPIPELTVLGGMMVTRGEAATLLRGPTSRDAVALGLKLLGRHALDRLRYSRGTRLVLGNALAGRLLKGLLDAGVEIRFEAQTTRLIRDQGRVVGVQVRHDGREQRLAARCGVVLAAGGFPASEAMRAQYLPQPVAPYTAACPTCTGDTLRLAASDAGAALGSPAEDNALWFPSSVAPREDGSLAVYPHIVLDRAKPGLIAVNAQGRRFVNEAVSYHEFVRGMYKAHADQPCIPAFLVCDAASLWRYGLGMILPKTLRLAPYIHRGYLFQGASLAALAQAAGIDPDGLAATVARYNGFADTGLDDDFGRGTTSYERNNGDPRHGPNPCIGPLRQAPFYAVRLWPTPLGTSLGLSVNADAQVIDTAGHVVEGLYACGNDMNSVFGGQYPGAGAQLGPGMTFGYLAATHAAQC